MRTKIFVSALLAVGITTPLPATATPSTCDISISDDWVRAAPPNAHVMAGYLTIHNQSSHAITVTGLTSPRFKQIQLHETREENGIASMVALPHLHIRARGSVSLKPGGIHLMLIEPLSRLRVGDKVAVSIDVDHKPCTESTLTVKK